MMIEDQGYTSDDEKIRRGTRLPLNDLGNAGRLWIWYSTHLRFDAKVGWQVRRGGEWEADPGAHWIRQAAHTMGDILSGESDTLAAHDATEEMLECYARHTTASGNSARINAMIREAEVLFSQDVDG